MEEKIEKKKKNKLVVPLVIAVIIIIGLCGFIAFDKLVLEEIEKKDVDTIVKDKTDAEEEKTTKTKENSPYRTCTGTYKGKGIVSQDMQGRTQEGNITVELNADNSYKYIRDGMDYKVEGNYVILGDTLFLLEMKHTSGPKGLYPSYASIASFVIEDDCSKIHTAGDESLVFGGELNLDIVK